MAGRFTLILFGFNCGGGGGGYRAVKSTLVLGLKFGLKMFSSFDYILHLQKDTSPFKHLKRCKICRKEEKLSSETKLPGSGVRHYGVNVSI